MYNLSRNRICDTDSYKASHFLQYPPSTMFAFDYFESRGGRFNDLVFFGLQYILKEFFKDPITMAEVIEANDALTEHGEPFNLEGWTKVVMELNGRLPLRIRAVPEGVILTPNNVIMTIENTVPGYAWLVGWFEAKLQRIWYTITVASLSFLSKKTIYKFLLQTADDPDEAIKFALHDFGSRGVSCKEQAMLGGMAHLLNFRGTDTFIAVMGAREYYNCQMAGYSVPASEHSTMTIRGREGEVEAIRNMIRQFGGKGKIVSVVPDAYDYFYAVDHIIGEVLRDEIIASGCTLVVRPDSGTDPVDVVAKTLISLDRSFGSSLTNKGFKVLNHTKVLQGDGITLDVINDILNVSMSMKFCGSSLTFGMGGGLLQKGLDRDTNRFAVKLSAARIGSNWVDVFKDPITDPGKKSKRGLLDLVPDYNAYGQFKTVARSPEGAVRDSALITYFEDGRVFCDQSFTEIISRVDKAFMRGFVDELTV